LATVALLVPITAVIMYGGTQTYSSELSRLQDEARSHAAVVAAHIDGAAPSSGESLALFLSRIPGPVAVVVRDASGRVVAEHPAGASNPGEEMSSAEAAATMPPWTVTASVSTRLAFDRYRRLFMQTVAITAFATLLVFVLEMVFVRRFLRSFTRLERSADRVGAGDLSTLAKEPMPSRELEHVHQAFRGMVDNLREAREAIARQVEEERRMRQELELLQQQIIRQERLAAIGLLLSGIAHELNNPLQAISGFAELLQRDRDVRPDVKADLKLIQKESARASGIIRNLSRFSRQQNSTPTAVYLYDVVASVVELRQRRLQEQGISLDLEEQASQPVTAILTELQQVLLNFVVNAEQAIAADQPPVRRIVIRTRDTDTGVRVEVEDTGAGVRVEDESKLFQPFFTTKPVGEGTGLGLSVSYGIIRSSGGTIGYSRSPLGGARFFFELPSPDPGEEVRSR
jgi:C4-dicarboxylate-specific signal transduction histidine kinase